MLKLLPIYKKESRSDKNKYRPVSILNGFSNIYERFTNDKLLSHANDILSDFVSAYRSKYSSNHMILRLIEEWKEKLDKGFFAGAVLMDLSKAFDCIPHDLLIAKLNAHGFDRKSLVFFYSYLKRRKQCVNVNNMQSTFQTLLSGVPQGSIHGPLLFNIFINDLIGFIKKSSLYNFADDNTITAFEKDIILLKETLQNEAEIAIEWFKDNFMVLNPGKFQAMVINRFDKMENKHSVRLLGIEVDNQLNFDNHVSTLCKKADSQLNATGRLRKYSGFPEKNNSIEAFVFSNLNYCPLVSNFTSIRSTNKIESIQKRALRLLCNDYTSTYDSLLAKANKPSMELKHYRTLAFEIFKTLNVLNPTYMQDLFYLRFSSARRANSIAVVRTNTSTYGTKSLRSLGPQIWNSLPEHIKAETSLAHFRSLINTWFCKECLCNLCKHVRTLNSTNY